MAKYKGGYQIIDLGLVDVSGVDVSITDENILNIFRKLAKSESYLKPILLVFSSVSDKLSALMPISKTPSNIAINVNNFANTYNVTLIYSILDDTAYYNIAEF